jgi:hypothetical protein
VLVQNFRESQKEREEEEEEKNDIVLEEEKWDGSAQQKTVLVRWFLCS